MSGSDASAAEVWLQRQGRRLDLLDRESAVRQLLRPAGGRDPHVRRRRSRVPAIERVLMILCQKPLATGSGIVVRELAERVAASGREVLVMCGVDDGDNPETYRFSGRVNVAPVVFRSGSSRGLPFPIVGMSDRMPYESTRFRDLNFDQLDLYLEVWRTQIRDALRAFQPDIVHVHHLWLLAALAVSESRDAPVVVSVHGTDLQQADACPHLAALVSPWSPQFAHVVVLTARSQEDLARHHTVQRDRVSALGNGFNPSLFTPTRSADQRAIELYNLDDVVDRPIALFVGKFVEWKGIEWLIRAFAKLKPSADAGAVLVIAGGGAPSDLDYYRRLTRELHIAECARFIGELKYEHVGIVMNRASLVVLPSFREPFGLVLLEALACGVRIVATNQGGPAEFVPRTLLEREDAILIDGVAVFPSDPSASASFIERLASAMDRQLAKPLAPATRSAIAEQVAHLTWDRYVDALLGRYRDAAAAVTT